MTPRDLAAASGGRRAALVGLCLDLLLCAVATAEEPMKVANEAGDVVVLRVAKVDSLHGGMLRPPSDDEAFLLVYLETEDPCFDTARNLDCFGGERDEWETIAWACGEIEIGAEDVRPADGGGLLDGELACSYVVPADAGSLILRLREYPEIDLEPSG